MYIVIWCLLCNMKSIQTFKHTLELYISSLCYKDIRSLYYFAMHRRVLHRHSFRGTWRGWSPHWMIPSSTLVPATMLLLWLLCYFYGYYACYTMARFPHPVIPANRELRTKGGISSNKWQYNSGGRVAKKNSGFFSTMCWLGLSQDKIIKRERHYWRS